MHAALDLDHGVEVPRHVPAPSRPPMGSTLAMSAAVKYVWDGFGVWRGAA